jgi:hypothetical protein
MREAFEVVNEHRQEYQHQRATEKQLNNLIDVAGSREYESPLSTM